MSWPRHLGALALALVLAPSAWAEEPEAEDEAAEPAPAAAAEATVQVRPGDGDVSAVLESGGRRVGLTAAETLTLPAGEATLEVSTPSGTTRSPLQLAAGSTTVVDLAILAPGRLTVRGLPAGTTFVLLGQDLASEQRFDVGWGDGEVETDAGVSTAESTLVGTVPGGRYTWRAEHRLLGTWTGEETVEPGKANVLAIDATASPGFAPTAAAYRAHLADVKAWKKAKRRTTGTVLWTAVAAGGAGFLALRGVSAGAAARGLEEHYGDALDAGDLTAAEETIDLRDSARTMGRSSWAGAAVALGVTGFGVTLALGQGKKARSKKVGAWDPETVDAPWLAE